MSVRSLSQNSPLLPIPQPQPQPKLAPLSEQEVEKVHSIGEEWLRTNRPKTADTSKVVLLLARVVSEHQDPAAQKALNLLLKGFDHPDPAAWKAARQQIIAIYNRPDHSKHEQVGRALVDKLQVTLGISAKEDRFMDDLNAQYPEFTQIVQQDLKNFPGHKEIVLHHDQVFRDINGEEGGEGGVDGQAPVIVDRDQDQDLVSVHVKDVSRFDDRYFCLPEIEVPSIDDDDDDDDDVSVSTENSIAVPNNEEVQQNEEKNDEVQQNEEKDNENNIIDQDNHQRDNCYIEYSAYNSDLGLDDAKELLNAQQIEKQEEIDRKKLEIKQKKLEIEKLNQEKWKNFLQAVVEKHDRYRESMENGRPPEKVVKILRPQMDINEKLVKKNFDIHIVDWNKENNDTINVEGNCIYKLNIKDVYEKELLINLPTHIDDLRTVRIDCQKVAGIAQGDRRKRDLERNDLKKMIDQELGPIDGNQDGVDNQSASIRRIYHKDSGKYSLLVKQGQKAFLLTDNKRGHNVKYMNVMQDRDSWGIFANNKTESHFDKWLRKSEPFGDQDFQLKCLNSYLQSDKAVSVCHPYDFMASFDEWLAETIRGVEGDLEQQNDPVPNEVLNPNVPVPDDGLNREVVPNQEEDPNQNIILDQNNVQNQDEIPNPNAPDREAPNDDNNPDQDDVQINNPDQDVVLNQINNPDLNQNLNLNQNEVRDRDPE